MASITVTPCICSGCGNHYYHICGKCLRCELQVCEYYNSLETNKYCDALDCKKIRKFQEYIDNDNREKKEIEKNKIEE